MRHCLLLLLVAVSLFSSGFVRAELTQHFRDFLDGRYGDGTGSRFERTDMGRFRYGSFGGKQSNNDTIVNQPVVFVHGVTLRAGVFMAHRQHFLDNGYSDSELYATTYADGGQTPFYYNSMSCSSVTQVREFISAVYEYTNSTVDVIAYSMGVAISRKAILGGTCVDSGEQLGRPLTEKIDAYVGVAGVAYGMENCPQTFIACNENNGMHCESKYLREVNSLEVRYEGNVSYSIYSRDDFLVGQKCCGHTCSELKNADVNVVRSNYDHVTVFTQTKEIQLTLVRNHTADL